MTEHGTAYKSGLELFRDSDLPCAVDQVSDGAYPDGAVVDCSRCAVVDQGPTTIQNDARIAVITAGFCRMYFSSNA